MSKQTEEIYDDAKAVTDINHFLKTVKLAYNGMKAYQDARSGVKYLKKRLKKPEPWDEFCKIRDHFLASCK